MKKADAKALRRVPDKIRLKKDDLVVVISGKDKGKQGKILRVLRDDGALIVEKVNMVKKTQRKSQQHPNGGIVDLEAPVHVSKVMLVDPKTGKPTRIGYKTVDGAKVRVAKKSGKTI